MKSNKMIKNCKHGFSLVELIVTIAILAVMAAVLSPALLNHVENSRAKRDEAAMAEVARAVSLAAANQESYEELMRYSAFGNVSCYIDTVDEDSLGVAKNVTNDANEKYKEQYNYSDEARHADEVPFHVTGNMKGVTISFIPEDGKYVLSNAVINGYLRPRNMPQEVALMSADGTDDRFASDRDADGVKYTHGTPNYQKTPILGSMTRKGSVDTFTYDEIVKTCGLEIPLESRTYKHSVYTVFIDTTDGNIKTYGQFNGTNLSEQYYELAGPQVPDVNAPEIEDQENNVNPDENEGLDPDVNENNDEDIIVPEDPDPIQPDPEEPKDPDPEVPVEPEVKPEEPENPVLPEKPEEPKEPEVVVPPADSEDVGVYYIGVTDNKEHAKYRETVTREEIQKNPDYQNRGFYILPAEYEQLLAEHGAPKDGDVFVSGHYEYRFQKSYKIDHSIEKEFGNVMFQGKETGRWNKDNTVKGWDVRAIDDHEPKGGFGEITLNINNVPVTNMDYTFAGIYSLTTPPAIPTTARTMNYAFANVVNFKPADPVVIPENIVEMNGAFMKCEQMSKFPDMTNALNVESMDYAFYTCASLKDVPDLSYLEKVTTMDYAFAKNLVQSFVALPKNVQSIEGTFQHSTVGDIGLVIPETATNMTKTFENARIWGVITVNANNVSHTKDCFKNIKVDGNPIYVTGPNKNVLNKLAATSKAWGNPPVVKVN